MIASVKTSVAGVALVLSAMMATACGPAAEETLSYSSPAVNATAAPLLPTDVAALPATSPEEFDALIDQLRGTPVVVNLWGSWCEPCKEEAPELARAAREHPDIQFVGIDILDSKEGAYRFIRRYSLPYPNLFDPPAAIRTHLNAIGAPDTFFYSADGELVSQHFGQISAEDLERAIRAIEPG